MSNEWVIDFITGFIFILIVTSIVSFAYRIGNMTVQYKLDDKLDNTSFENAEKKNRNY